MTRIPLILAHEALCRLARTVANAASIPPGASSRFVRGRWYVERAGHGRAVHVVWPEGSDGDGWTEYADAVQRGPVFTVVVTWGFDDPGAVIVTLTRDEVTGEGAEVLRRQRAEDEARWWRENGGES